MTGIWDPCPNATFPGPNSRHILIEVYRRRFRDLWRKTFWLRCPKCDGQWRTRAED